MVKTFLYLRTSGDDGRDKAGLPLQKEACRAFAAAHDFEIDAEYADDGVTGKLPMHARPQGKLLIAALLGNGVRTVLSYDAKRIGRTQPAYWSFVGLCRDNGITILDANGTNLCESVMGGVNGMLAEMDRDATVARLAAGKAQWRGKKRVDGRHPFGMHANAAYNWERDVVARILVWHANGESSYRIAKTLNETGVVTRYGCRFTVTAITTILHNHREGASV